MAVFSSVIVKGVIAGTLVGGLGSVGLLFMGEGKLQEASNFVNEAKNKIVQYEVSENSLMEKLGLVKAEANDKINGANTVITSKNEEIKKHLKDIDDLTNKKNTLEAEIVGLNSEINTLTSSLNQANADLTATRASLAEKTKAYDAKVVELKKANDQIAEYIRLAQIAYDKAQEADGLIKQLEGELHKANAAVDAHDAVVDQAKEDTDGKAPMTSDELNGVDTSTEEVIEETPAAE